jgi:hypothetical protein
MCSFFNITWHYFAAIHEAFRNTYTEKDVPNKIHLVIIKFRDTGTFYNMQYLQLRTGLTDVMIRNFEEKLA